MNAISILRILLIVATAVFVFYFAKDLLAHKDELKGKACNRSCCKLLPWRIDNGRFWSLHPMYSFNLTPRNGSRHCIPYHDEILCFPYGCFRIQIC